MQQFYKLPGVMLALILFFAACEKTETPSYQTEAAAKVMSNLAYGKDAKQVMDVYLPPNRSSNTSVIVFIHGGSFVGGDKNEFTLQAKYLAACGYAVVNINYRLVDASGVFDFPTKHKESAVKVKDQVSDVSAAVDFAISKSKEWVVSGRRVAIAGHSAGGTLALLYGYDTRNVGKVQAISNIAGALDLIFTNVPNWEGLPSYVLEAGFRYTGFQVAAANEQHYKAISPLYTANSQKKIPTLNVFPEHNDVEGLPKQDISTYHDFTAALNELKVPNEFVFVTGADHIFSRSADWVTVLDKTVSYFNRKIK